MNKIIEPSQDVDYDDPLESIQNDAQQRGLSDDQIWATWQAGIAAQQRMHLTAFGAFLAGGFVGGLLMLIVLVGLYGGR